MSKADSIKDIRFKLRKLCDITDELMENLPNSMILYITAVLSRRH